MKIGIQGWRKEGKVENPGVAVVKTVQRKNKNKRGRRKVSFKQSKKQHAAIARVRVKKVSVSPL